MQRRGTESESGTMAQAKDVATDVAGRARTLVGERLSERTTRSARDIHDLAEALKLTSRQLENNFASPMIRRAADGLTRASELLENARPDEFVKNVERFAKREPWLFVGGAVALGLLGSRFLKSTAAREERPAKKGGNGARARGERQSRDVEA